MKALNQTLGFYTPAFFKIYIETINIDGSQTTIGKRTSYIYSSMKRYIYLLY